MNVGRDAAKIYRLDRSNEAFACRAVFFGFSASAPEQLHSMGCAAFRADTFDRKSTLPVITAGMQTIQIIRQTVAVADYRHFHISP
jgi:hypothetical protein